MKIKMIALDLDRTTLNRNGRLSDENRKVLTELLNRGIHVIPASPDVLTAGDPHASGIEICDHLHWGGGIPSAGAGE